MISVLVVDDHPVVRRGILEILNEAGDMDCCGTAENGREAFSILQGHRADVALLDLTLREENGFDVLKRMKEEYPTIAVLILSMHPEDQYALRLLKAGAAGYLNKESMPGALLEAIRRVAAGGRYISPALADVLATERLEGSAPRHDTLSDREFQVMTRLAKGKGLKEIGEELFLSAKTVSTYRQRVLTKMGMKCNADLTRYMIEHNLPGSEPAHRS
jgi:two-component system, NarL family, invasion response regulator UvrY